MEKRDYYEVLGVDRSADGYAWRDYLGPGVEENTHKIGECVDTREMAAVIAFLGAYPAILRQRLKGA